MLSGYFDTSDYKLLIENSFSCDEVTELKAIFDFACGRI